MHDETAAAARPAARRLTRRDLALGLAAAALGLLFNLAYVWHDLGILHHPGRILEGDHWLYLAMAQRPLGEPALAPFCWRILTPWLASGLAGLGFSLGASFYAITCISLLVFLQSLYLHLRQRGLDEGPALVGVGLAALVPGGVRWYLYQYPMADPLCLGLVGLAFVAIHARRDVWLLPLGVVALATRESFLLVLPYFFLYRWQSDSLATALRSTLRYLGLPLAVLVSIRLGIEPSGAYDLLAFVQEKVQYRIDTLLDNQIYFATVGSFGVLLGAVLLLPGRLIRVARGRLPELAVLVGAYASLLVASNTDRLLAYALPVVVPAAVGQVVAYGRLARVPWVLSGFALLAVQIFTYDQTLYFQQPAISIRQPTNAAVVAAVVALWTLARLRLRWARSATPA